MDDVIIKYLLFVIPILEWTIVGRLLVIHGYRNGPKWLTARYIITYHVFQYLFLFLVLDTFV